MKGSAVRGDGTTRKVFIHRSYSLKQNAVSPTVRFAECQTQGRRRVPKGRGRVSFSGFTAHDRLLLALRVYL